MDKEDIAIYLENCFEDLGLIEMASLKSKDIGEWNDDHKFNLISTSLDEYEKQFENLK